MNNLRKFNSEAEYNAATLNYPSVAWVTGSDTVHFDKTAPVVNNKVMMAWHSPSEEASGKDIVLWNAGASLPPTDLFNSLTINNVDVMDTIGQNATLENYSVADTDYLVKYELKANTTITDVFSGDLGGGWGSSVGNVDFLIPAQITQVSSFPSNVQKLVIEATTPPTTEMGTSGFETLQGIYVPTDSINAYKSAWSNFAEYIHPISEYQGNLPV